MSQGLNKLTAIGNLGKDPELKYTPSGGAVCSFSLAVNESWKDQATGEKKEHTEWLSMTAWGKTAEIISKYACKGTMAYVEGRIRTKKVEKDGETKYYTNIYVDRFTILKNGRERDDAGQGRSSGGAPGGSGFPVTSGPPMDDDIPF